MVPVASEALHGPLSAPLRPYGNGVRNAPAENCTLLVFSLFEGAFCPYGLTPAIARRYVLLAFLEVSRPFSGKYIRQGHAGFRIFCYFCRATFTHVPKTDVCETAEKPVFQRPYERCHTAVLRNVHVFSTE